MDNIKKLFERYEQVDAEVNCRLLQRAVSNQSKSLRDEYISLDNIVKVRGNVSKVIGSAEWGKVMDVVASLMKIKKKTLQAKLTPKAMDLFKARVEKYERGLVVLDGVMKELFKMDMDSEDEVIPTGGGGEERKEADEDKERLAKDLEERLKKVRKERDELSKRVMKLVKENERLKKLEKENEKLKKEVEGLREKGKGYDQMKFEKDSMIRRYKKLSREHMNLKYELQALEFSMKPKDVVSRSNSREKKRSRSRSHHSGSRTPKRRRTSH